MPHDNGYDAAFVISDQAAELDPANNIDAKEDIERDVLEDLLKQNNVEQSQKEFDYVGRVLFSPLQATSNAILSIFDANDSTQPLPEFVDTLKAAVSGQEAPNVARDIVERNYPDMSPKGKAAAEFAFGLMSDPTMPFLGGATVGRKALRNASKTPPGQSVFKDLLDGLDNLSFSERENLVKKADAGEKWAQNKIYGQVVKQEIERQDISMRRDLEYIQPKPLKNIEGQEVPPPADLNYLKINSPEDVQALLKKRISTAESAGTPTLPTRLSPLATAIGGPVKDGLSSEARIATRGLLYDIDVRSYRLIEQVKRRRETSILRGFTPPERVELATLLGARSEIAGSVRQVNRTTSKMRQGDEIGARLLAISNVKGVEGTRVGRVMYSGSKLKESFDFEASLADSGFANPNHLGSFLNDLDQRSWGQKRSDTIFTIWIQSLLSNPWTVARNAASNAFMITKEPIERALVGDASGAAATAKGFLEGWADVFTSWNIMKKDPGAASYQDFRGMHEAAVRAPRFSKEFMDQQPRFYRNWQYMLSRVRPVLPGQVMGETDSVFKSVAYQQSLRLQAARLSHEIGVPADVIMENVGLAMEAKALENAKRVTFQQGAKSNAASAFLKMRQDRSLRFLLPFVKTPLNVARTIIRYTPGGLAFKDVQRQLLQGGPEARLAAAKLLVPSGAVVVASQYINPNLITGGGASYTRQNEMPKYSIRLSTNSNTWFSYAKIDALRWSLGALADAAEVKARIDWESSDADSVWLRYIAQLTNAGARVLQDNLWFDSIAAIPQAIASLSRSTGKPPEERLMESLAKLAKSTANPGIRRFANQVGGQPVQDLINDIPVQRVGLLGEPQRYTFGGFRTAGGHPLYDFYRRAGVDVPRLPRYINSNELTMAQRAEWRQLRPQPSEDTPPLADTLTTVMADAEFWRYDHDTQLRLLNNLIGQYTKAAALKMQQRYPDLLLKGESK